MWCGVQVKMGLFGNMIFGRVLLALLLGPLIKNVVMSLSVLYPLRCFAPMFLLFDTFHAPLLD